MYNDYMKSVPISEFKAKCLRLVEDVRVSGEPLEITKRGKQVAIVNPPAKGVVDWRPGAFSHQVRLLGNIQCDLSELGVEMESLS